MQDLLEDNYSVDKDGEPDLDLLLLIKVCVCVRVCCTSVVMKLFVQCIIVNIIVLFITVALR